MSLLNQSVLKINLILFLIVCLLCNFTASNAQSRGNDVFLVESKEDTFTLSNELITVRLDPHKNYVCTGLFKKGVKGKSFVNNIEMVADLEHKVDGQWKGFFESNAKLISKELERSEDMLRLTVKWQNKYLQATKIIELPAGKDFFRVKYSCYVYQKIPLRILATPLVEFPGWMNKYSYKNRSGEICKFGLLKKNGKILASDPGRWYASGNNDRGVVVALPGLKRDYHLFSWPPEFFRGRTLLRNFNVLTSGLVFPHKVAFKAIGDDIFTADLVIGPYKGDPQKAVDKMLNLYTADTIKFDNVPENRTAKLAYSKKGVNIWADYTHSHHLKKERLSSKSLVKNAFEIAGARNQRVGMQLVVNPDKKIKLKKVAVEGFPFASEVRLMRYVKLSKPSATFPLRNSAQYPVSWPDPLVPFKATICEPGSNQGLLITFSIPSYAKAGKYTGKVRLSFANHGDIILPLNLRVFDFSLPVPRSYQNKSDLNMFMVKYTSHEKGEEPETQKKYAQLLAKHNLSPQDTVYGWDGLVTSELYKKWSTVSLPRQASMIAFEGTFSPHRDWQTGKLIRYPQRGMTRKKYEDFLLELYRRNITTLREQGVKGPIYAIATDGPLLNPEVRELVTSVINKVKKLDPDLRIIGCTKNNFDDKIAKLFDVVVLTVELDKERRKAVDKALFEGDIKARWTYVNQWSSIDSPPVALRTIYWEQFFRNISGCWNWGALGSAWSRQKNLYAPQATGLLADSWGVGYLIYPPENSTDSGPVPSLRLAQIMSGIDDYEYLRIWSSLASGKNEKDKEALEKQLKEFATLSVSTENFDKLDPEQLEIFRIKIAQAIERMKKIKKASK